MKVRVCPACGKVNKEEAFICVDCGQTLSIKTLMDTDSEQFLNSTPFAGQVALINIAPAFQRDAELILNDLRENERFVWGCNVTTLSAAAPFKFGFLIFTTQRLMLTYFDSDLDDSGFPERSNLAFSPTVVSQPGTALLWALDFPHSYLTRSETASRSMISLDLDKATSAQIEQQWVGDAPMVRVIAKFSAEVEPIPDHLRPDQDGATKGEISVTFIFAEDAEKAVGYINEACN